MVVIINPSLLAMCYAAIERDDIQSLMYLLSTNSEILNQGAKSWTQNPLELAFKCRSFCAMEEIARRNPEFASDKNKDGETVLHLACAVGDLPTVKTLVRVDPQLCFVNDNRSMNPLQRAIVNGHIDVISELVSACPDSLGKVTPRQETVLHLAAKRNQDHAFEVLLKEIKKLNQEHLLHRKDQEGNNILHIAVSNRQIGIVKLLLPQSSTTDFAMRVNSMNQRGFTALDLYYMNPRTFAAHQEIGHVLLEAGAREARSLLQLDGFHDLSSRPHPWWLMETRNMLLVVLVMIVGAAFTTVCNLPSSFHHVATRSFQFSVVISGKLPPVFYLMAFNTAALTLSMGIIMVLIYSIPFGNVLVLVVIAVFFVYVLLVDNTMPKFSVKIGSDYISSSRLMWMLAITFILFGAIIIILIKCLLLIIYEFTKWQKRRKLSSNLLSRIRICFRSYRRLKPRS